MTALPPHDPHEVQTTTTADHAAAHAEVPPEAARLEGPLILRDGTVVHIRPIHADDMDRLRAFHLSLSPDTIIFRFFHFVRELPPEDARRFTHVDYHDRMALIATVNEDQLQDEPEHILGVVRYDLTEPGIAEVAFVVEDHWQGHGIATALLHRLADYARGQGISQLVAITMGSNMRMLEVLRTCGFPSRVRYASGDVEVHLDISQPPGPFGLPPHSAAEP